MARKQHSGITEQRKAGIHRLEDARVLFRAGRWRGSMYLAGYAVECQLKYKLMQRWSCFTLEQLEARLTNQGISNNPFTHNLDLLLTMLSGWDRMKQNPLVWGAFTRINDWRPSWRYSPQFGKRDVANRFLVSTQDVVRWIENNC